MLQTTIDDINTLLDNICQHLFTEPLFIRLCLSKTLKSTGKDKPTFNLTVNYNKIQYNSVQQLSGGEADRVSLALTLALFKYSRCPILLLDECLSSLNDEIKHKAVTLINQLAGHRIVCLIEHSPLNHDSADMCNIDTH